MLPSQDQVGEPRDPGQPPLDLVGERLEARPRLAEQPHGEVGRSLVLAVVAELELQSRQFGDAGAEELADGLRALVVRVARGQVGASEGLVVGEVGVGRLDV